jgi:hypothetical protein
MVLTAAERREHRTASHARWRRARPEEYRVRNNAANLKWSQARPEASKALKRKWAQEHMAEYLMSNMRKRERECTISLEEMEILLEPMTCALTGWKLRWDVERAQDLLAPSPDRIDSRMGYVSGNVRIVAWVINRMRSNMSDEELLDAAAALLKHAGR